MRDMSGEMATAAQAQGKCNAETAATVHNRSSSGAENHAKRIRLPEPGYKTRFQKVQPFDTTGIDPFKGDASDGELRPVARFSKFRTRYRRFVVSRNSV